MENASRAAFSFFPKRSGGCAPEAFVVAKQPCRTSGAYATCVRCRWSLSPQTPHDASTSWPEHWERERLYNYRLSRARRMVECSFGILAAQWRLYRRVLGVIPEMAEKAVKATCILHNLLRVDQAEDHPQAPSSEPDSTARAMGDLHRMSSNNSSREAITIREKCTQYFSSTEGAVPWQENII